MTEITYNDSNYLDFLQSVAGAFGAKVKNSRFVIPQQYGEGYFWIRDLQDGVSIMVNDSCYNEDVLFKRLPSNGRQFFILHFNESVGEEKEIKKSTASEQAMNMLQNLVVLTNSFMHSSFFLPAKSRTVSVSVIFEKNYLLNFLEATVVDAFLSNYFSLLLKSGNVEPIDADYRILLKELAKPEINHPFATIYIQNRVLLLIEKFISKFLGKWQKHDQVFRLKDDEINRLIKVEALLVKDYSGAPPIISSLSRIAAMSPTKLKKDFKLLYGLPVYEYYQKNRMMRAKQLLLEGSYAIKEVGMMVGYTNLGHFAASFKKIFGTLPSEMNAANNLSQYSIPIGA